MRSNPAWTHGPSADGCSLMQRRSYVTGTITHADCGCNPTGDSQSLGQSAAVMMGYSAYPRSAALEKRMALYRKKPVIIDATQWNKDGDHPNVVDIPDKVLETIESRTTAIGIKDCRWIGTLEGGHIVSPGDWIITGVHGEQYPCKPDIFASTYESVQGPSTY